MNSLGLQSRAGFEKETFVLRVLALFDFALILAILLLAFVFLGFDDKAERLFLLSSPHILLAFLLFATSIRFGFVTVVTLFVAVIQLILNSVELALRIFSFSLAIGELLFILINIAFLVIAFIAVVTTYRVYSRQSSEASSEQTTVQQEANSLRAAAMASVIVTVFLFILLLITLPVDSRAELVSFMTGVHLVVALYTFFLGLRGGVFSVLMIVFSFALAATDFAQLALRVLDETQPFTQISIGAILAVLFLFINIGLLFLDTVYILSSIGYYAALSKSEEDDNNGDEEQAEMEAKVIDSGAVVNERVAPFSITKRRRGQK